MEAQDARARYRKIYLILGLIFSFLLALAWTSYGLTQNFAKGTANYAGAIVALAGMMTSQTVNCFIIGKNVMVAGYDKQRGCFSFYYLVLGQAFYPGAIIAACVAVIVCSIVFGVRYEQRVPENDQVNNDANFIMGILNLILGTVVSIISSVALYYGTILKRDLEKAADNRGPFANLNPEPPKLANY